MTEAGGPLEPVQATVIRVHVLGAIAATIDGYDQQAIPLGGARQRCCLAALAIDHGRVVPSDRLAERVWPGRGIETPRSSLRTVISRLRSSLGADAVVTDGAGYRLATGGARPVVVLDSEVFERLVAEADELTAGPQRRLELLDAALALWGGPAYDEWAPEDWARAEAERLEELHAVAIEQRFEALLGLGRHLDAIPGLVGAVERFPLRERLVGLHMLALHRAGRQADALRQFQLHRTQIGADLGLEPGRDLIELDRRIASGDPALHGPPSAPAAERTLRGYRLGETLGEGAFSIVVRAVQPSIGRDVAIKVIRAELANRPEFIRRFEVEAHLVAALEHPHIVPLYDYWREPDRAYLVFRHLRGGTLAAHLERHGPLGLEEVDRLVAQIGSALATAHRFGVIHRDVKPANVFLDDEHNFYLGDFGIALDGRDPAIAAGPVGTPTSPNEASRRDDALVGPSTDVFALASTILQALTARSTLAGGSERQSVLGRSEGDGPGDALAVVKRLVVGASAATPGGHFDAIEPFMAAYRRAARGGADASEERGRAAIEIVGRRNPYKGLRAFDEADAGDFHGRTGLVDRLVALLSDADATGGAAMVVGPSGIGKSSFLLAALLPALRRGAAAGSERWYVANMMPGVDPFEALATALVRIAAQAPSDLASRLGGDPRALSSLVQSLAPEPGGAVLLLIDQFEELFTLCPDETVRQRFLDTLEHAVTDPACPLRLVMTIRADLYDRPLRHGGFARLVEGSTVAVTALPPDELEAAIVEPATAVRCEFEPGLVAEIMADVANRPGALPLLQYALTQLFERRVSGLLTRAAYRELGGVGGALVQRAESLTDDSSAERIAAIRALFGRLVALGPGSPDMRRRVRISDLGADPATAEVVETFGASRLLSFDHDPSSREPTVEIAHEALIQRWPRLQRWIDEDRDDLRLAERLSEAASGWDRSGRDPSELYRGARLDAALRWYAGHPAGLSPLGAAFLTASEALEETGRRREALSRRRLRRSLAVTAAVAVIAMVASLLAMQQRGNALRAALRSKEAAASAEAAEFTAETGRLAALATTLTDTDLPLSLLLATEAVHRAATPETLGALQRTFLAADASVGFLSTGEAIRAVFADGGSVIGVGTKSVTRWDGVTRAVTAAVPLPSPVAGPALFAMAPVSYAAGRLAWVDADHVAWTMLLAAPEDARVLTENATDVAVSPSGEHLAVATADGGLGSWRSEDDEPLWSLPPDGLSTMGAAGLSFDHVANATLASLPPETFPASVLFSAGGATIAHTRAGWLHWVDASTGRPTGRAETIDDANGALTNASQLAVSARDGSVFALARSAIASFGPATPQHLTFAATPPSAKVALVLLPDDRAVLVTESGDLAVVDPRTGATLVEEADARIGRSSGAALLGDSTLLVAGARGIALHAIDGAGLLRSALPRSPEHLRALTSPDARWVGLDILASPSAAVAQSYWFCPWPSPCAAADPLPFEPGAWVSPAGDTIWARVVYRFDGAPSTVQLFDFGDDQVGVARSVSSPVPVETRSGHNTLVAKDRSWFATSGFDFDGHGRLQVHALPGGEQLAAIDFAAAAPSQIVEDPSGRVILLAGSDGERFTVDTADWTRHDLPATVTQFVSAAYSDDGRWLATIEPTGDIVLRDPDTFVERRRLSSDGGSTGGSITFSTDSRHLLATQEAQATLYDVDTGEQIGAPILGQPDSSPTAFSGPPAGVAIAGAENLEIWHLDPATWPDIACRSAGRNLSRAEWEQYGPRDAPYRPTCPQWPSGA